MKCPVCGYDGTTVTGTPYPQNERSVHYYRYRKCLKCDHHFKTIEYYLPDEVVKKIRHTRIKEPI